MNNRSVYDKIIDKGQEEAQEIIKQGQKRAQDITEQTLNDVNNKIQKLLKDNELKNADLVVTKKAELEQSAKQKILSNQKRLINETFNLAVKKLQSISDIDLVRLVKKCLALEKLDGTEIIKVSSLEFARYQKLFSSNNNTYLDKLNLNLANEFAQISGGFILVGKYYDIDYSYETIINDLMAKLETEVASKLFGE